MNFARELQLLIREAKYLDQHPDVVAIQNRLRSLSGATRKEVQNIALSTERAFEEIKSVEEEIANAPRNTHKVLKETRQRGFELISMASSCEGIQEELLRTRHAALRIVCDASSLMIVI